MPLGDRPCHLKFDTCHTSAANRWPPKSMSHISNHLFFRDLIDNHNRPVFKMNVQNTFTKNDTWFGVELNGTYWSKNADERIWFDSIHRYLQHLGCSIILCSVALQLCGPPPLSQLQTLLEFAISSQRFPIWGLFRIGVEGNLRLKMADYSTTQSWTPLSFEIYSTAPSLANLKFFRRWGIKPVLNIQQWYEQYSYYVRSKFKVNLKNQLQ